MVSYGHQLIKEIYLLSLSPAFPHTCQHLYSIVKSFSPSAHAYYLLGRHPLHIYHAYPSNEPIVAISSFLSTALKYPITTLPVLEALYDIISCSGLIFEREQRPVELPIRLFSLLGESDATRDVNSHPLPILRFLWEDRVGFPKPTVGGRLFECAVHANFVPLVEFLLEHGAHPEQCNYLPIKVAIGAKNLKLVKVLMESRAFAWRKRYVLLEAAVECDAQEIVNYLMVEQHCDALKKTKNGKWSEYLILLCIFNELTVR